MTRTVLWRISENARITLILGLAAGLALPGLASALQPWLPQMIAVLLTVTALRIGHRAALGALRDLRWGMGSVAVLQVALPMGLFGAFHAADLAATPVAMAVVLATAAPALSGSANLALMLGQNAGRMMQILILGTALFPLTVLPVFTVMPQLGTAHETTLAALTLLAVILTACGTGFALRAQFIPQPDAGQTKALDGLSVLAFSVIVVALMAALNPALRATPGTVGLWAALAFVLSYGIQIAVYLVLRRGALRPLAGPLAIGAGNRNIGLFLVALPPEVIAPMMVFIGCWQLPMYLTPILLRWLYKKD